MGPFWALISILHALGPSALDRLSRRLCRRGDFRHRPPGGPPRGPVWSSRTLRLPGAVTAHGGDNVRGLLTTVSVMRGGRAHPLDAAGVASAPGQASASRAASTHAERSS